MRPTARQQLELRWQAIAAELADITAHRIVPERLAISEREQGLLAEQDEIEHRLGMMDAEGPAGGGGCSD